MTIDAFKRLRFAVPTPIECEEYRSRCRRISLQRAPGRAQAPPQARRDAGLRNPADRDRQAVKVPKLEPSEN